MAVVMKCVGVFETCFVFVYGILEANERETKIEAVRNKNKAEKTPT